ncbi:glycosyltransferase family 4 protein [Acidithiobacillus albertensis]|uniref:glycosyltransferase family 4 protein n=1 Tax=Acidithiobacillus albertensis TaxID=119978 RepID=UPI00094AD0B6|nr:glycosyltransferase family 4 protein [Acidithiobacillus albertensis]
MSTTGRRLLWVGTNPGGGGTETHMITMCRALADVGVDMHVFVHPRGHIGEALSGSLVKLHYGAFRNSADVPAMRKLWKIIRHVQPDWLIGSFSKEYWPLAILSRMSGCPLALFRHMDLRLRPSTRWLLSHWPLRLFAISEYLRRRLIEQGIPPARVEVLLNPIHLTEFHRDAEARHNRRRDLGLTDADFLLGFVGAWHRGKGVFMLADAIDAAHAQNAHVHGLWLGGGAHEETLRSRLANKPWHHVLGWQNPVMPWYSVMDALALPSIEPDTFGRVCLEAQACGTPVLGADIGGIPESFVDGQGGWLLPAGDVVRWENALLSLLADPALRENFADAGPVYATGFASENIACKFLQELQQ